MKKAAKSACNSNNCNTSAFSRDNHHHISVFNRSALYILPILSDRILKRYKDWYFNNINNFYCFIKGIMWNSLHPCPPPPICVWWWRIWWIQVPVRCLRHQECQPKLFLFYQCKCQHSKKGKQPVSIILKIVFISQTSNENS